MLVRRVENVYAHPTKCCEYWKYTPRISGYRPYQSGRFIYVSDSYENVWRLLSPVKYAMRNIFSLIEINDVISLFQALWQPKWNWILPVASDIVQSTRTKYILLGFTAQRRFLFIGSIRNVISQIAIRLLMECPRT